MSITIQNARIQTFERNLRHLAQQAVTKLRPFVMERATNGQSHNWDRIGFSEAAEKTAARTATPFSDLPWSRRRSTVRTWHKGESVEQEDVVQMLIDPNSNVTMSLAMAMRRQIDKLIISAATGDATDGTTGNPVAFPTTQRIGNGSLPISFEYVTEVQQKFMSQNIDPDVPKVAVVGPTQVQKLMQLTEHTSKDYVRRGLDELSQNGIVPSWMGFTWVMSTLLEAPSAGQLDCLFFTKRALGLQVNRDITARVAEDPTRSFMWILYAFMSMVATRVEDEHIVNLRVADSL